MELGPAILTACGGLGLFLFGMSALVEGLSSLAGDALSRVLARFTRSPLSGALTGATLTAVLRSSSATTVAAVGFVGAGLLSFSQALGIVFGANLGTTTTGWIVALLGFKYDIANVTLPMVLVGALLRLLGRGSARAAGSAIAGFGLLFVGLELLRHGMSGLQGVLTPESLPGDGLLGRAALVGLGLALTVVTQSSSAGVAAALSALAAGAISWPQAAALVIGMDVGTTVTAALATIGSSAAARRTGLAHVVFNVMTGVATFLLLPAWAWALRRLGDGFLEREPELALVAFHTGFNLLGVLAVLPVAGPFARLMERLVPERRPRLVRGLDPAVLGDPPVALRSAHAALDELARALFGTLARLYRRGASRGAAVVALSSEGEALVAAREFLGRLRTSPDRPQDHARHEDLMHALDHLDRLADRGRRGAPPRELDPDGRLAAALRALIELLDALALSVDEPTTRLAHAVARDLALADERSRLDVMHRSAAGELSPTDALHRLDAQRNLRRVADHASRIADHLRAADPRAPAVPADPPGASPPRPDPPLDPAPPTG